MHLVGFLFHRMRNKGAVSWGRCESCAHTDASSVFLLVSFPSKITEVHAHYSRRNTPNEESVPCVPTTSHSCVSSTSNRLRVTVISSHLSTEGNMHELCFCFHCCYQVCLQFVHLLTHSLSWRSLRVSHRPGPVPVTGILQWTHVIK